VFLVDSCSGGWGGIKLSLEGDGTFGCDVSLVSLAVCFFFVLCPGGRWVSSRINVWNVFERQRSLYKDGA